MIQTCNIPFRHGGAMTVGNFDGVHLGHRELIEATIGCARQVDGPSVLYTFYPHPVQFLYPDRGHRLLCSFKQSQRQLSNFDLDHLVVQPFTKKFAMLSPETFLKKHILDCFQPKWLVVGSNFRFGKGRCGSVSLLREMAPKYCFKLKVIEPIRKEGRVVSTSAIKELVSLGQWDRVRALLGRCFSIKGLVVKGRGLGKELGFPTINIKWDSGITLPQRGVYAVFVREEGLSLPAVLNLGYNPTFSKSRQLKTEVHIIGWGQCWHNKECEVEVRGFIRPEKKFLNKSALVSQIKQDIKQAQKFFATL